ncbi:MAG: YIP1 family protein [Celeribacter sp.]|jgi:hypothetical protein
MAITTEILRSYRAPRAVMRTILAAGPREDRAIAWLMSGCAILFIAQWPRLSREAYLGDTPLDALVGGAFLALVFLLPLLLYGIAAISHLFARIFGGRGTFYSARAALFWTLLAVSPLVLLRGLVSGMIGPGPALVASDAIVAAGFFAIWAATLYEAERHPPALPA